MDKSLDEIISTNKTTRRPRQNTRRGSARAQILGKPVASPVTRARASAAVAAAAGGTGTPGAKAALPTNADKIIVSNLPDDVNEAQIKELFASTVGPTRNVNLSYDASGKSKGVAAVTFSKKGDANRAYQQYHNRLIDGKRPMKIEIVVDPSKPATLASRVAPAAVVTPAVANGQPRRGGRPARGRRGGGPRKTERKPKTAADLDAEMEDYTASNAPAAAVPAPAAPTATAA